jgi:hypothetical protein
MDDLDGRGMADLMNDIWMTWMDDVWMSWMDNV